MIGELIVTFCERGDWGTHKAVELWAYRDGTMNLVVARDGREGGIECSFPCTLSQLTAVLDGRALELEASDAKVRVELNGDLVCARFNGFGERWRQCIDNRAFEESVENWALLSPFALI